MKKEHKEGTEKKARKHLEYDSITGNYRQA